MARVRIEPALTLKSWDDVNICLAEIGEHQRDIGAIEAKMQAETDAAKLAAGMKAEPHKKRIKELEKDINAYLDAHSDDLGGKKTKKLTFGEVGYRASRKVGLPQSPTLIAGIIEKLKAKGMAACIVTPPATVSKDALKRYPDAVIREVGATVKNIDAFWYEVDRAKLEEEAKS